MTLEEWKKEIAVLINMHDKGIITDTGLIWGIHNLSEIMWEKRND